MTLDLLLIAGATGASLIGAELLARIYLKARDDWFVHAPYSRSEYVVDPIAFPRLPPTVRVAANSDGERGSKLPRRPDDLYRVLVAGGSAAECYMLDQSY